MESSNIKPKLVFDGRTPAPCLMQVLDLEVGDVFKISSDYETVMNRIKKLTPLYLDFEIYPITPGTSLYTMYGPDHCIVTKKSEL